MSVASITIGCSSLDTSSDFSDVVNSIKERNHYVEVYAKSIQPDTKSLVGADLVKSELTYTSVQSKGEKKLSKQSSIDMSVSFFKNYDTFHTATLNGKQVELDNFRPTSETCTEHCTVTQWFRFPFSNENLEQFKGSDVTFTISSGKKNTIEVVVPKAYFEAVEQEGLSIITSNTAAVALSSTPVVDKTSINESKTTDMIQYWYDKSSTQERELFAQFAIKNRKGVVETSKSDSQSYNMLQYWYSEADQKERSEILQWLINQ